MHSVSYASSLWFATISLEVILAVLVLRRRVFANFPIFTIYVLFSTVRSLFLWGVYRWIGYQSPTAFYIYWITEALQVSGHVAVCAELCWRALRRYPGLLGYLARDVFVAACTGIFVYAAFDSVRVIFHVEQQLFAVERGVELAVSATLFFLLLIAIRYRISMQRASVLLAMGLCFYTSLQVVNITFLRWLANNFPQWNNLRVISFQIALALWIWALARKTRDSEERLVEMVPQMYEKRAKEVSGELRALDEELEEIIKR